MTQALVDHLPLCRAVTWNPIVSGLRPQFREEYARGRAFWLDSFAFWLDSFATG